MPLISDAFAADVVSLWKDKDAPDAQYFERAEAEDWKEAIWAENSIFQALMSKLNLKFIAEIACGRGRHAAYLVNKSEELYLVDTSVAAIEFAANRFRENLNVKIFLSEDGVSLPNIPDRHLTAVYSFDSMVHFEPLTIAAYLSETGRVLSRGGRALFHHSNYSANPTGTFKDAPGWRNYMTQDLFAHFASRAGLTVMESIVLDWCAPASDALTLLEKK